MPVRLADSATQPFLSNKDGMILSTLQGEKCVQSHHFSHERTYSQRGCL